MSEHPSSQLLDQYNRRTLPSDIFLKVHRHILSCPECDEKCNKPGQLREDYEAFHSALLSASAEEAPSHLSTAEAEGYIKNELGEIDLEIAESHLELCVECRESVRQLRAAHAHVPQAALSSSPARSERARRHLFAPSFWPGGLRLRHVAALSVGLLLILGALTLIRTRMYAPPDSTSQSKVEGNSNQNSISQGDQLSREDKANSNKQTVSESSVGETGNENDVKKSSTTSGGNDSSSSVAQNVLVINDDGHRIVLDARGGLSGLENLSTNLRQEIKEMLLTGRVRRPPPEELNGERATLLSESSGDGLPFRLSSPIGKIVPDNRPTFRWEPLSGAESYTVIVADAQLNQVSLSEPLKTTRWKIRNPLKYGETYSWQVTALKDGKKITSPVLPAPQARFKVLAYDKVRELRQIRKAYANSHLSLAAFYIRAGMIDEAEEELRALVRSNPQSSTMRSLLGSLRR